LESLYLSAADKITDRGVEWLVKNAPNLKIIFLPAASRLTDVSLERLADCPSLTTIDFGAATDVTDRGLEFLAGLANLRQINLKSATGITPEGLLLFQSRSTAHIVTPVNGFVPQFIDTAGQDIF